MGVGVSALNLPLMIGGYYLFGLIGAFGFVATFGVAIMMAVGLITVWSDSRKRVRKASFVAILLAFAFGSLFTYNCYAKGLHQMRERARVASRLQLQLKSDPRFTSVFMHYQCPPKTSGEWLTVRGNVRTLADYNSLNEIVSKDRGWQLDWEVTVTTEDHPQLAEIR